MTHFRRRPALLLLLLTCLAGLASTSAEEPGLPVGKAWAGHPVSFDILTGRGHQFVAYYDADRRITVAGRRLGDDEWTTVRPGGQALRHRDRRSNETGWDSHNYLRLAMDKAGCVHLSGNMHNDPLVYYRTRQPLDLGTLERHDRMVGRDEDNTTYPVFFKDARGELLFRYRDGSSGSGSDIYNRYDSRSGKWARLHSEPLIDGEGRRNAYACEPLLGPDRRFHLAWMWRDTPDAATNHTLSYLRSADLEKWEDCRGKEVSLPVTFGEGDVVDPAKPREGLINMTFAIGFDARNRPVVAYHRYDKEGRSQVFASRPVADGSEWKVVQLSDWDFRWDFGGGGSIAAEVVVGPPQLQEDGTIVVAYETTHAPGAGRWKLDGDTLEVIENLPPADPPLSGELARPVSDYPGMEVRSRISREGGRTWLLRWETLSRNRDRPRAEAPPASELRVFEIEGDFRGLPAVVGS